MDSEQATAATFARHFRTVLGHFPTGVVAITAIDSAGDPTGMTIGSYASVSLNPPLVAFFPDKSSSSFPRIRDAGSFCVNVLSADQEQVCRNFSAKGTDKYAGLVWRAAGSGSPILDGAIAWMDCDIVEVQEAGDHYLVLGRVRALDVAEVSTPLIFFQGGYGRFTATSLTAPGQPDLLNQLGIVDIARPYMEQVAGDLGVECVATVRVDDELVIVGQSGQPAHYRPPSRLGQRVPFVPPMGTPFMAWSTPVDQAAWIGRATPETSESTRGGFRQMLTRVRERGWSIALSGPAHLALERAVADVDLFHPTEQQRAALTEATRQVGEADGCEPASLPSDSAIKLRQISAPVFDEDGATSIVLSLYGLPRLMTPDEVARYRDRLLEASAAVTRALNGKRPD